jgi:hypothetical protein
LEWSAKKISPQLAALPAHQAAVDATKSPQREEVAKAVAAGEFRLSAGSTGNYPEEIHPARFGGGYWS